MLVVGRYQIRPHANSIRGVDGSVGRHAPCADRKRQYSYRRLHAARRRRVAGDLHGALLLVPCHCADRGWRLLRRHSVGMRRRAS